MKPIGGYFEWEFPAQRFSFPNENGVLLNNNRSAIQLIIQHLGRVDKLYIPYYICDSVTLAMEAIGVPYSLYHIDKALCVAEDIVLGDNEYLLYTNYFGIQDAYCRQLAERYGDHLIVDNAQGFYAPHIKGTHSAYSVRKFIGVPDGGIAVSDRLSDYDSASLPPNPVCDRCGALLARAEGDIATGYKLFHENDERFRGDGIRRMSEITKKILHSVNHDDIIARRRQNFAILHEALGSKNKLRIPAIDTFACPLVYPFLVDDASSRDRLIENKVFVARYWPNVLEWCDEATTENYLTQHIVALPIDQRCDGEDMKRIITFMMNDREWI